ncbi:MAG TPA: hypothetical protein VN734_02620 [Acidobacteriaceae bacterium]|nr:hypothetical protein [Acidobacteriaceae bacterium]
MKTTFVRAVVLTLTVAGLAAPSMTSAKTTTSSKALSTSSSWSGYPTPICLPGSGNYCGMQ